MNPYVFNTLLEKMCSPDTDFRFMAVNDLINELTSAGSPPDDQTQRRLVGAVLKLMDDKNGEVQNLAIKCLGTMAKLLREAELYNIVEKLCDMTGDKKESLRDIANIALKTVIMEIQPAAQVSANLMRRLVPRLLGPLEKDGAYEIQMDSLDTLSEALLRFGNVISPILQLQQQIQNALQLMLANSRPAIRKRATTAIGYLVAHTSDGLFDQLLQNIISELKQASNYPDRLRTYIQCIATMSRFSSHRVGRYLPQILPLVMTYSGEDDDELRENCLLSLEIFVLRCPTEMTAHISPVIDVCLKYLQYDPNYDANGDLEDENMATSGEDDEAEDDEDYSDDDDMSWKVRRASTKTLSAIIGTRHEMLAQLYRDVSPAFISRFKEREESVRVNILQTYILLLRKTNVYGGDSLDLDYSFTHNIQIDDGFRKRRRAQSIAMDTDESPKALLKAQLPQLCRNLAKLVVGKSTATRQACFTLLRELVTVLRGGLENYLELLVPAIQASLSAEPASSVHQAGTNHNLRIETLMFVRALLRSHSPAALHDYLPKFCHMVSSAIGDKFYKITAEALVACTELVRVIRPLPMQCHSDSPKDAEVAKPINGSGSVSPMDPSLLRLAKEIFSATIVIAATADADQEVKERSITCLGTLIAHCGDVLSDELGTCLPILLDRLRNEVTRLITVKAVSFIANTGVHQPESVQEMMLQALDEVVPLLRKTHRGLRVSSALCLEAIVRRYGHFVKPSQYSALISELQPLVSDADLHLLPLALETVVVIIAANPRVLPDVHSRILPSVFQLVQSPLIQGLALGGLLKLFTVMVRANEADFAKLRDGLLQPVVSGGDKDQLMVSKQAYAAVAQCVAALCLNSPSNQASTVKTLARNVQNHSLSNSVKYVTLMTLGEVGRNIDLSQHATLYNDILNMLTVPLEEVKSACGFALGNIAVGNIPKYLPVIISEIRTQPKRQYLLLHALKEVITRKAAQLEGRQQLEGFVEEIWLLLFNNCESTEEGTRNVVAECLGKLTLTNPFQFLPELKARLKGSSSQTRATVITAIKYTFTDAGVDYDELLRTLITELLSLLQDDDLNVRRLTLSTLNSATHNKPHLLYDLLHELLPLLYEETIVKPELIRTVEMGPFKHKVDDGLEIRKSAFECMLTIMDTCFERIDVFSFLDRIIAALSDQHEIMLVADLMLIRLAKIAPTAVTQKLDDVVAPYRATIMAKLKPNAVKQEIDRSRDQMRSALRTIAVLGPLSEPAVCPKFDAFLKEVTTGQMAAEYQSVSSDRDSDAMDLV